MVLCLVGSVVAGLVSIGHGNLWLESVGLGGVGLVQLILVVAGLASVGLGSSRFGVAGFGGFRLCGF